MKTIYFPLFLIVLSKMKNRKTVSLHLANELNITYSHMSKLKKELLELKWIGTEDLNKRTNNLFLTDKGNKLVDAFHNLLVMMDIDKENIIDYRLHKGQIKKEGRKEYIAEKK